MEMVLYNLLRSLFAQMVFVRMSQYVKYPQVRVRKTTIFLLTEPSTNLRNWLFNFGDLKRFTVLEHDFDFINREKFYTENLKKRRCRDSSSNSLRERFDVLNLDSLWGSPGAVVSVVKSSFVYFSGRGNRPKCWLKSTMTSLTCNNKPNRHNHLKGQRRFSPRSSQVWRLHKVWCNTNYREWQRTVYQIKWSDICSFINRAWRALV